MSLDASQPRPMPIDYRPELEVEDDWVVWKETINGRHYKLGFRAAYEDGKTLDRENYNIAFKRLSRSVWFTKEIIRLESEGGSIP